MMLHRRAVARAARALDAFETREFPTRSRSWVDDVDPDTVDLGSGQLCVLGQAYGDFYRPTATWFLQGHPEHESAFGVDVLPPTRWLLTRAWRRELRRRVALRVAYARFDVPTDARR